MDNPSQPVDKPEAVELYLEASHAIGERLLNALDQACSAIGVQYFAYAGTLLGAVRTSSWIPWDDDIDVAMFRKDFEIFRAQCQKHLPADVVFSDWRSDPAHLTKIPRLLYLDSERVTFARQRLEVAPETVHVGLDIFVIDRAPRSDVILRFWLLLLLFLEKLSTARATPIRERTSVTEAVAILISRLFPRSSFRRAHLSLSTLFRKRHSAPMVGTNHFKRQFSRIRLKADDFLPSRRLTFGTLTVPCPARSEDILTQMYGKDYMRPPAESDRVPLHFRNGLTATIDGVHYSIIPEENNE